MEKFDIRALNFAIQAFSTSFYFEVWTFNFQTNKINWNKQNACLFFCTNLVIQNEYDI